MCRLRIQITQSMKGAILRININHKHQQNNFPLKHSQTQYNSNLNKICLAFIWKKLLRLRCKKYIFLIRQNNLNHRSLNDENKMIIINI